MQLRNNIRFYTIPLNLYNDFRILLSAVVDLYNLIYILLAKTLICKRIQTNAYKCVQNNRKHSANNIQ